MKQPEPRKVLKKPAGDMNRFCIAAAIPPDTNTTGAFNLPTSNSRGISMSPIYNPNLAK